MYVSMDVWCRSSELDTDLVVRMDDGAPDTYLCYLLGLCQVPSQYDIDMRRQFSLPKESKCAGLIDCSDIQMSGLRSRINNVLWLSVIHCLRFLNCFHHFFRKNQYLYKNKSNNSKCKNF